LPSLKEGFGLPLSEGLYYGLPIIAFDLESYQEQVNLYSADDRITFVPLNSISNLQNEMTKAIRFPKEKESISQIKKRIGNWTWSHVADTYCDYIWRENGVKN
jgi:glycosyltransferase involved in cell wall biosynthesis